MTTQLETQPTKMPTRKSATVAVGTVALAPLIQPAVFEVWPQMAPQILAGDQFTALLAAAIAAAASLAVAWFVPDRAGLPR